MKKLSIITCVYNGDKYITRLFESVMYIKDVFVEHIIIDDGSVDSTSQLVEKYKQDILNRKLNIELKYFYQDNQGLGSATNQALKKITGDYWTWINCDDWYLIDKFEPILNTFEQNSQIDFVHMNYMSFYAGEDGSVVPHNKRITNEEYNNMINNKRIKSMLYRYSLPFIHYIVKTSSFKIINPTMSIDCFRGTQDVQLAYQLYGNLTCAYHHEPVVGFLYRNDSFYVRTSFDEYAFVKSGINSLDYLSIGKDEIMSQKNAIIAGYESSRLMVLFGNNKREEFITRYSIFNNSYKELSRNYKKYINRKVLLINVFSKTNISWRFLRLFLRGK